MAPLAISALDVAYVSALAAIAAPLVTWAISRATRGHELAVSREARIFDARREAYEATLEDMYRDTDAMDAVALTFAEAEVTPPIPEVSERDAYLSKGPASRSSARRRRYGRSRSGPRQQARSGEALGRSGRGLPQEN